MNRSGMRFLMLIAVVVASAAVVQAGPVFQAAGFNGTSLGSGFTMTLTTCPTSGTSCAFGTGTEAESGSFGGGSFIAKVTSGTLSGTTFSTFCLETTRTFSSGSSYIGTVDPKVLNAGTGNVLTQATQYLYTKYLTGALDTLTGGAFSYTSQASYTSLQEAFWSLEGQTWGSGIDALGASIKSMGQTNASATTDYGVKALNLWTGTAYTGTDNQSQMVWIAPGTGVGTPEPSTMILLGICLVAFAAKIQFLDKRSVASK